MTRSLSFSNFNDQEFDVLAELLCNVFKTTKSELAELYQKIIGDFSKEGWPHHFVERNFFQSEDRDFCETYKRSPVIAVDLPSLFELDDGINNKPTVVILGQDSKSDQDHEKVRLGTPYGLHHKGSREVLKRTKLYFEMITTLLNLGYRVYLTDIYKVWVCDPDRPYYGIRLPRADKERFLSTLRTELLIVNPVALVTWGKEAGNSVTKANIGIQHLNFPHPSGAAGGTWKKLMNQSPTYKNKLAYWNSVVSKSLPKRA